MGVQVTALNENVATLKREWQGSQRRVGELEKQTDELRGEIAVLEATVQNNQDERRALLERCVVVVFKGHIQVIKTICIQCRAQKSPGFQMYLTRHFKTGTCHQLQKKNNWDV